MGFASLALGPLGLLEALIVLAIVLFRVRRFPERTGGYLLGASVVPVILLGSLIARMPSCDIGRSAHGECYAGITGPALIGYGLVGLLGAVLLGMTLRRLFDNSAASSAANK
jgi:hypothetical protein